MRACEIGVCCKSGVAVLASLLLGATSAAASQETPLALPAPVAIPAGAGTSPASAWIGGDISPGSRAAYAGGIYALNGDLSQDGFLIRSSFSLGSYDRRLLDDNSSHISFQNVNVLVGYQSDLGGARVAFFAGPDFTHNGSGASEDVRGSSWGVRGIADIVVPVSRQLELSAWGTYTTIESQYYVQARALYRPSAKFRIGPEAAALGGDNWSRTRAGAHAAFGLGRSELGISVGHEWNGDDGLYANAILSFAL